MIVEGFQDRLLQKLSAIENARLQAEALRRENTPQARSTVWSDFRRSFSWGLRQQLRGGAMIVACLLVTVLAAKISPILLALWSLALCLIILYQVCRFLYAVFSVAYVFLTWKRRA